MMSLASFASSGRTGALLLSLSGCAMAAVGCSGGQSGSEGELPAAPCARHGLLLQGHISELGGGCVALTIDVAASGMQSVADGGGTVLLDANVTPGQVVRGRLGQTYSYTHDFELGEAVAALPEAWSTMLNLQLMPVRESMIQVQWARSQFLVLPGVLTSAECEAALLPLRDDDDVRLDSSGVSPVAAEAPEPRCGDQASPAL
jgi:hypothetical protein